MSPGTPGLPATPRSSEGQAGGVLPHRFQREQGLAEARVLDPWPPEQRGQTTHLCGCLAVQQPPEVSAVSEVWGQVNGTVYNHKTRYSGDSDRPLLTVHSPCGRDSWTPTHHSVKWTRQQGVCPQGLWPQLSRSQGRGTMKCQPPGPKGSPDSSGRAPPVTQRHRQRGKGPLGPFHGGPPPCPVGLVEVLG